MAQLKPPGTGEKRWHMDQGYFRLWPPKVAALWIALDPTDAHNGCMFVAPKTHAQGTAHHGVPKVASDGRPMSEHPMQHAFYSVLSKPPLENVFPVPMAPGDAILFDGNL